MKAQDTLTLLNSIFLSTGLHEDLLGATEDFGVRIRGDGNGNGSGNGDGDGNGNGNGNCNGNGKGNAMQCNWRSNTKNTRWNPVKAKTKLFERRKENKERKEAFL